MKDPWYRQCTYEVPIENGKKVGVSWIPEKLAKVGGKIYFGKKKKDTVNTVNKSGEPRELWTITSVGGRQLESFLIEHRLDYKHQRKMSDI